MSKLQMYRVINNESSTLSRIDADTLFHQCSLFKFIIDTFSLVNANVQKTSKTKPCPLVGIDGSKKFRSFNTSQIENKNEMHVNTAATI